MCIKVSSIPSVTAAWSSERMVTFSILYFSTPLQSEGTKFYLFFSTLKIFAYRNNFLVPLTTSQHHRKSSIGSLVYNISIFYVTKTNYTYFTSKLMLNFVIVVTITLTSRVTVLSDVFRSLTTLRHSDLSSGCVSSKPPLTRFSWRVAAAVGSFEVTSAKRCCTTTKQAARWPITDKTAPGHRDTSRWSQHTQTHAQITAESIESLKYMV